MEDLDTATLAEADALTSPAFADVRIDFGIARAEFASQAIARQTAELWRAVAEVLDDAERHPEHFLDARAQLSARERRDYAIRSAAADLAVRLGVAESTVRAWGGFGSDLRRDAPRVWMAFCDGRVSAANARLAAETLATLPGDARAAFDELVAERAERLAPARFRTVVRAARERVHAQTVAERHRRAEAVRRVVIEDDIDGMSWLSMLLPTTSAHRAFAAIDASARRQQRDERTHDQRRADAAVALLTGDGTAERVGVSVAVTVPVLTLLGASDDPGTLDGVGPIDADTARELAAHARSFTRLLTHPLSGAVLALDRTSYRVPADLQRMLAHRDRICRFAGCGRRASRCDIDHITEWQDGGATDAANLMHLCRHHHRLKSVARWRASPPDPVSATVQWRSPTGAVIADEPPPF